MIMAISLAGFTAILYLLFKVYPLTKIILSPSKKKSGCKRMELKLVH
jgi:hypothetical protein